MVLELVNPLQILKNNNCIQETDNKDSLGTRQIVHIRK